MIDGRQRHDRSIASGEFVPLLATLGFMPGMQLVGPTFARSSTRRNSGRCVGRVIAWILIAVSLNHVAQILLCPRSAKNFASKCGITGVFCWPKSVRTADCENMQKMGTRKVDLALGRA